MHLPKSILVKERNKPYGTPRRFRDGDAGFDIFSNEDKILWPFQASDIDSGWDIKIPHNHWGTIKSRSSTFKHRGLFVFEGIIDPNYTGKLSVLVWNPMPWPKIIRRGERLAQLVVVELSPVAIKITDKLPTTNRGADGFGSSGK